MKMLCLVVAAGHAHRPVIAGLQMHQTSIIRAVSLMFPYQTHLIHSHLGQLYWVHVARTSLVLVSQLESGTAMSFLQATRASENKALSIETGHCRSHSHCDRLAGVWPSHFTTS